MNIESQLIEDTRHPPQLPQARQVPSRSIQHKQQQELDSDEGYQDRRGATILQIIIAKEVDKMPFFVLDPMRKEAPQDCRVSDETDVVPKQELRTQTPPEETTVCWMTRYSIYSGRDEHMILLLA